MAVRTVTRPAQPVREAATATGTVQTYRLPVVPRRSAMVVKTLALHTSMDRPAVAPLSAAVDAIARAPAFPRLLSSHKAAWQRVWEQGELHVSGEAGRILRLHVLHLLQTLSPHTAELDVGVPARGLHGEAYRGHVFWDELFVLPYLDLHFPEVARGLLMYRHRRPPAAREAARLVGRQGAMYPWQSASSGREEAQVLHLNPRSGRWLADHYQASKQADTLMLGYLFRLDDLYGLFDRLGYPMDDGVWRATVAYYLRRTSHGSTLSSLVHGWVLARQKGPEAWRYCEEALLADVADVQGGTTGEGVQLGAMAGTIDLVERGITGLETGPEGLRVAPVPLAEIPRFAFTLRVGRHRGVRLRMLPGRLAVRVPASSAGPLAVFLPGDRRVTVAAGQERWFRL